jgi:uncharacterized coiled-coil protein SlyX
MNIDDIEKRIISLEDKVNNMDKEISIFTVYRGTIDQNTKSIRSLESSNVILERLSVVIDKLSDAVAQIQITLVTMGNKLTENSDDIAGVKNDVGKLKESVEEVDEKGKFDFIKIIRDNAIPLMLGGGAAYIFSVIMEVVSKK